MNNNSLNIARVIATDCIELHATQVGNTPSCLVNTRRVADLIEAYAAVCVAREMEKSEWQPIATAPRDGTEVLVWGHVGYGYKAFVASWKQSASASPTYDGFRTRVTLSTYTKIRGARFWMPILAPITQG